MERLLIQSNSPWEKSVGFSRAVRVGPHVWVAGTAPVDAAGNTIAPGDAYEQTRAVLEIIETALKRAGADLRHVVRTRIFLTGLAHEDEIARAHRDYFDEIRPVSTMVEVVQLVRPDMMVEIEVDAFVHDQD